MREVCATAHFVADSTQASTKSAFIEQVTTNLKLSTRTGYLCEGGVLRPEVGPSSQQAACSANARPMAPTSVDIRWSHWLGIGAIDREGRCVSRA